MILAPGLLDPPAGRLLGVLAAEGETVVSDPRRLPAGEAPVTIAVSTGPFVFDFVGLVAALGGRPFRALVLSRLGAHPDARHPALLGPVGAEAAVGRGRPPDRRHQLPRRALRRAATACHRPLP